MIIVSACLAGIRCRYDGGTRPDPKITEMVRMGEAIPVCPEVLGGLPVPRDPAELTGSGEQVLDGQAKAVTRSGKDVTQAFLRGAQETLRKCREYGATTAILSPNSPSCGCGSIYDGSFTHTLVKGDGVTSALLKRNGIHVCVNTEQSPALTK